MFLFSVERFNFIFSKILRLSHLNSLYFFPSSPCKFTRINTQFNPSLFSEMRSLILPLPDSTTFVLETVYSYSLCQSVSLCVCLLSLCFSLFICFRLSLCRGVCVYASVSTGVFFYGFVLVYAVLCMCVFSVSLRLFFCFFVFLYLFPAEFVSLFFYLYVYLLSLPLSLFPLISLSLSNSKTNTAPCICLYLPVYVYLSKLYLLDPFPKPAYISISLPLK